MVTKTTLTREQLAAFLPDHQAIRVFERLLASGAEIQDVDLQALVLEAATAGIQAVQALDEIQSIQGTVEFLERAAAKAQEALDAIAKMATVLEYVAIAPIPQPIPQSLLDEVAYMSLAPVPTYSTPL